MKENLQIKARLSSETSEMLKNFMESINKDINEKITLSDVMREALKSYIEDNDLSKKGKIIKLRFEKGRCLNEDMDEVFGLLDELSKKHKDNRSMKYINDRLRAALLLMQIENN